MPARTGPRVLLLVAGVAAVAVVVGTAACGLGPPGPDGQADPDPNGPSTGEPGGHTWGYTSSPLPVSSDAEATPTALHPLAGGPVPDSALELEMQTGPDGTERAALQTPSGNIVCVFGSNLHGCGVLSYHDGGQYGSTDRGPRWWFDLSGGARPAVDAAGTSPEELRRGPAPQVLDYGQVAASGEDVCASEQDGLTCWNARTGHGVHLSRDGYQTF